MLKNIVSGRLAVLILIGLLLLFYTFYRIQTDTVKKAPFLEVNPSWADTVLKNMSIDEKVAQLILLEITNINIDEKKELQNKINKIVPGGILFQKTNINTQLILTHAVQATVKIPVIVASKGTLIKHPDFNFPAGMFLGACQDSLFLAKYIFAFAKILSQASVNIDFSARVGEYSQGDQLNDFFSDDKKRNLKIASEWNEYLFDRQIITCVDDVGKYLNISENEDTLFTKKLEKELKSFHALKIETTSFRDTLSAWYEKKYAFKGLLFTDWDTNKTDSLLVKAIKSGINMFIIKQKPENFILQIKTLIKKELISEKEIDKIVRKILLAKTWFDLQKSVFRSAEYRLQRIFNKENKKISWQIYEKTATVVKNKNQLLPLNDFSKIKYAFYSENKNSFEVLKKSMHYYFDFEDLDSLSTDDTTSFSHLIVAIPEEGFMLNSDMVQFFQQLKTIAAKNKLIILNFSAPEYCKTFDFADAIVQLYDMHPFSQSLAAQIICGVTEAQGVLPVKCAH